MLDGLPAITPYGVNNAQLKEIGRTVEAWMEVFNLDQSVPFYRVRASVADSAEVEAIEAGHFALAFVERSDHADQLPVLVDPNFVFGHNTALSTPDRFHAAPLADSFTDQQITTGKTPCAFFGATIDLQPGESITLHSVYGHVSHMAQLPAVRDRVMSAARLREMRCTANALTQQLTDVIDTHTSDPVFDAYCRQTFLDNVLRGGWPIVCGKRSTSITSTRASTAIWNATTTPLRWPPSSTRRATARIATSIRIAAAMCSSSRASATSTCAPFMSLIQADGYNPLVIQGSTFTLSPDQRAAVLESGTRSEGIPCPRGRA